MAIVQKSSGINSATFPSPTTAGNNIVVMVSYPSTSGVLNCTDNQSQSYLFSSNFPQQGNVATFWFARSFTLAGVTTVTVSLTPNANCEIWIYELTQPNTLSAGPPPDDADDAFDFNVGVSGSPAGSGLFNNNTFGTEHAYFAVCAVGANGGLVTGAAAGWTLDTVQNGNAVAYFDDSTGDKTVQFTVAPSTGFAISEVSFYSTGGGPPPPPCNLVVTPNVLSFSVVSGSGNPPNQALTVTNTGGGGAVPFTFTVDEPWIVPQTGAGTTDQAVTIGIDVTGLAPGNYAGNVTFSATCGSPDVIVAIFLSIATPCVVQDLNGNIISVFIPDLSLSIAPATALYTNIIPASQIQFYETHTEGRAELVLDFNNGGGVYARDMGTIFAWPMTSRIHLDVWQPSMLPQPEGIYGRATDWDNGGTPGNKFIQGVMVEADSFNVAKTFFLQDSDTLALHALNECPAVFNLQSEKAFSCSAFIAHSVRVISSDGVAWKVFSAKPVFQPWPEQTLNWQTEMTSLGLTGWGHLRELNIAHVSTQDLTLKLTFDAWPTITIVIPNSGGVQNKTKITLPANKFKLVGLQLTSLAKFNVFASDLEAKLGEWGRQGSYQVLKPIGGQGRTGAIV